MPYSVDQFLEEKHVAELDGVDADPDDNSRSFFELLCHQHLIGKTWSWDNLTKGDLILNHGKRDNKRRERHSCTESDDGEDEKKIIRVDPATGIDSECRSGDSHDDRKTEERIDDSLFEV